MRRAACQNGSRPLLDGIDEIIATYEPQQAAVEIVFVNVNPQSTLLLGQARGAAISALVTANLPVAEYTALQVKQAVVGHGKAAKEQVQQMVARLLELPGRTERRCRRCAGLRDRPRPRRAGHGRAGDAGQARARREAGVVASILYAWEFGANLGHIGSFPAARQ